MLNVNLPLRGDTTRGELNAATVHHHQQIKSLSHDESHTQKNLVKVTETSHSSMLMVMKHSKEEERKKDVTTIEQNSLESIFTNERGD